MLNNRLVSIACCLSVTLTRCNRQYECKFTMRLRRGMLWWLVCLREPKNYTGWVSPSQRINHASKVNKRKSGEIVPSSFKLGMDLSWRLDGKNEWKNNWTSLVDFHLFTLCCPAGKLYLNKRPWLKTLIVLLFRRWAPREHASTISHESHDNQIGR